MRNIFRKSFGDPNMVTSKLYNQDTFYEAFLRDLRRCSHTLVIESPFITTKRMNTLLPLLIKLRRKGVRIVVNTRNPDEHDYEYKTQAVTAVQMMQEIGIEVLYTVKHHRKLAVIDDEILWEGSLNILSQNDSCEIMRRIDSPLITQDALRFIGLHIS